jgi:hypothetical protein
MGQIERFLRPVSTYYLQEENNESLPGTPPQKHH